MRRAVQDVYLALECRAQGAERWACSTTSACSPGSLECRAQGAEPVGRIILECCLERGSEQGERGEGEGHCRLSWFPQRAAAFFTNCRTSA